MLRKNKKKLPAHKKYRQRIINSKRGRLFDLALIFVSLSVVVLLSSTAIRFVRGESKTLPPELTILRTQITNGCGVDGIASRFAEWVKKQNDDILKYDIIDISNYDNSAIPNTMVLVRNPLAWPKANMIAQRLGIDKENIVRSDLKDNFLALDITIVVGNDYKQYADGPAVLKTEILNGCGIKGAAKKFSIHLGQIDDDDMDFEITNEENFDRFDVEESILIIKSDKAEKHSKQLAQSLNIKKDNIIIERPGKKLSETDLTIVIGQDWGKKLTAN
jgi:LytR cell envelope-related transcriptional attenuator